MARIVMLCISLSFLLSGCVSRTVSSEPSIKDLENGVGNRSSDRIVTKKIVWIWQDEFRNPN